MTQTETKDSKIVEAIIKHITKMRAPYGLGLNNQEQWAYYRGADAIQRRIVIELKQKYLKTEA